MLILTRRIDEKLVITAGDKEIEVGVLGVNGCQVKIGIQADKDVTIDRKEIHLAKKQQREQGK